MRSDFSKPSADVCQENLERLENNDMLLEQQRRLSATLSNLPDRAACVVCGESLTGASLFQHRTVAYVTCPTCGHVQSKAQPPSGYPTHVDRGISFSQIYPQLDQAAYESRKNRIYRPKLDWILSCHTEAGLGHEAMLKARWLDLGCGSGYFLAALVDAGATHLKGIEEEPDLVRTANESLGAHVVENYQGTLPDAVRVFEADIYTAFFVLEHIENTHLVFDTLSEKPRGTVFVFAVPTFSFATILESAFAEHLARSLDSVIHTQLYTDTSINHALSQAGYERVAEWVFGQDAADLSRALLVGLREKYSAQLFESVADDLTAIQDQLQAILDRHYLASERHVLAVKK